MSDEKPASRYSAALSKHEQPSSLGGQVHLAVGTVLCAETSQYEVVEYIGEGGMGAVYKAVQVGDADQQPVAIKVFASDAKLTDQIKRREIGMLKALRHPHIVGLYDAGEHEGHRFVVIQYCGGGSIQDKLLAGQYCTSAESLNIFEQLLSALIETHSSGILHLDIKPANILIDSEGHYLLSDFGAARTLFQQNQRFLLGTPFFMSPEQARGEMDQLDARSDMYSLAATIWLLMYPEEQVDFRYTDLQKMRKTDTFPSLEAVVAEEDKPFAALIDRLLAVNPSDRPGSIGEVLIEARELAGMDAEQAEELVVQADPGMPVSGEVRDKMKDYMSDPITLELLTGKASFYELRIYEQGELICVEDARTFEVFMLLHGTIEVIRGGRLLFEEKAEGTILGEVSALAGHPRTATLRASGDVVIAAMNAAELEQAARRIPALSVRIMKNLARRVIERDQQGS